jgi:hypothetical protein
MAVRPSGSVAEELFAALIASRVFAERKGKNSYLADVAL